MQQASADPKLDLQHEHYKDIIISIIEPVIWHYGILCFEAFQVDLEKEGKAHTK